MKKVVKGNTIYFYDENEEIMYMDHSTDECIWFFNSDKVVRVTEEMELYELLNSLMSNDYQFSSSELESYKDNRNLVWYSDCYYNPDDEWSIASVSCLHIRKKDNSIEVWPTKKLDEILERKNKTYGICFSPAGNGKHTKNLVTGATFQDDFITIVYQNLKDKNKILEKK